MVRFDDGSTAGRSVVVRLLGLSYGRVFRGLGRGEKERDAGAQARLCALMPHLVPPNLTQYAVNAERVLAAEILLPRSAFR